MQVDSYFSQLVEQQLSDHFSSQVKITGSVPLGGGCINHTYKINTTKGSFFLKWNATDAYNLFECEAMALKEFQKANTSDLIFPQPILWKMIDQTPGFLIMELLESSSGNAKMEEKLGRGLAQLHKVSNNSYGFVNDNYCGSTKQLNEYCSSWIDFYRENRLVHLIELISGSRGVSSSEMKMIQRFLDRLDTILDYPTKPSLVHGDLWSGNYMYTPNGPALIDPAVSYSDREFEFAIMKMFGGFSSRTYDAYQEAWPLADGWEERNPIYQVYHILNHYFLFGGFYKNQAMSIIDRYA